jgi:flagellar FliL protein
MLKKKKKGDGDKPEIETEEAAPEVEAKTEAAEGGEGGEGEEGAPKKGKKKLLIIIVGLVLVLAIVGGLFAAGILGGSPKLDEHGNPIEELSDEEKAAKALADAEAAKPVYYELPQFLVNLNSTTSRVSFLKMSVTLELRDAAAVAVMDANKPRIQDTFNTYLRELRPADVQGSAGIYRLRTELLTRLNGTLEEGIVKDILFGEIIVQ